MKAERSTAMSIEEKLKEYILSKYGSVRAFVQENGLIYSNVDTILRRGIKNATWTNVRTFCKALGISVEEVARGNIAPAALEAAEDAPRNIRDVLAVNEHTLLDGIALTEKECAVLRMAFDIAIAAIRENRK